jgi:hypothetical protein
MWILSQNMSHARHIDQDNFCPLGQAEHGYNRRLPEAPFACHGATV